MVGPSRRTFLKLAGAGAERLPQSLEEALAHFRASDVLAEAMPPELFDTILSVRETEVAHFADASEEEIVAATRFRY
jgi:glutamine synthetase